MQPPDGFLDSLARLSIAIAMGGLVGFERQMHGQWVGLRTHMTVAMGSALFTIAGLIVGNGSAEATSRVVQGVAAGIGFLGAGTILKLSDRKEVKGLTTAGSIWLASALGTIAGLARYELAVLATVMSLIILAVLRPLEKKFGISDEEKELLDDDVE